MSVYGLCSRRPWQSATGSALPNEIATATVQCTGPRNDRGPKRLLKLLPASLKQLLYRGYVSLYRPLRTRFRPRREFIVLTYHRVSDQYRDSLTVGVDQFAKQMDIIAEHYQSFDLVSALRNPEAFEGYGPFIAVSFDDGYQDNADNAVPILRERSIPATFFVCTGLVGTEIGLPHDLDIHRRPIPVMDWSTLKKLVQLGFNVGSHTVTHINCAKSSLSTVESELIESRKMIMERLQLKDVIFAYPYGGRDDINPEVVDLVRKVGYLGCCSSYGGSNSSILEPFEIKRMGIDHKHSLAAFRARLEGYLLRSERVYS